MSDQTHATTPVLETPRLWLRPFRPADALDFAAYRSDPEVARYQSWETPFDLDMAYAFIEEMRTRHPGVGSSWYQWAVERRADGVLLGDCAFHRLAEDARQAEMGFTLARVHQGQGYAREAVARLLDYLFDDLGLHRVVAICDVQNDPSWHLLERLGLRREAHLVENIWFKGAWGSEYIYAVLEREWQAVRQTA